MDNGIFNDAFIEWHLQSSERILSRFLKKDWDNIFSGFVSDEEFDVFLSRNDNVCYVAYDRQTKEPFGFVLTYLTDNGRLQLHGGSWAGSTFKNYHALVILLESLLMKGYKVRTSQDSSNVNAFRFMKSIGFIKYWSTDDRNYLWLSEKKMKSSAIYRRIKGDGTDILQS